jgi:hypothetical protein
MLEADLRDDEPCGGTSTHYLSRRKGRLGFGKRHFGSEHKWVGYHKAIAINDPGGDTSFETARGSFLGPCKKKFDRVHLDQEDKLFDDRIDEKEWHSKKHFQQEWEPKFHSNEECPLGASNHLDLHTKGFLGKSKRLVKSASQVTTTDRTVNHDLERSVDPMDITSYGLGHRGKRKFLVQHNLEAGCRHNLSRPEAARAALARNASAPELEREIPENTTPFWQDDLPEEQRAKKDEITNCCNTDREQDRHRANRTPRHTKVVPDNSWWSFNWTPRKVDNITAAQFIEGGENKFLPQTDEEHREIEFRTAMGKTKRSYGNAHNKSDFRFDYNDDPNWKMEHYEIMRLPIDEAVVKESEAKELKEDCRRQKPNERPLMWGYGHGRKRFNVGDHLEDATDGIECFLSQSGAKLGTMKHKRVEDHLKPTDADPVVPVFFLDPDGKSISFKPRPHVPVKDDITEILNCDARSEDSNTLGVSGMRRKSELIRPHSARRFPQKDFERVTPRSVTPRPTSEARTPLRERPLWKK